MSANGNTPINLTLPLDAVNIVLTALSAQPYNNVVGTINSIQQQAVPQVQAVVDVPKPEPEPAGGTD